MKTRSAMVSLIIHMILVCSSSGQSSWERGVTEDYQFNLDKYINQRSDFFPRGEFLEQLDRDSVCSLIDSLRGIAREQVAADIEKLKLSAYFELGFLYFLLDEGDSTIAMMGRAMKLTGKDRSPWEYAMINALAAEACKRKGYHKLSNDYNAEILSIPEYSADTFHRATTLGFMAENYYTLLEYEKSMECCSESFNLFTAIGNYSHASYQLVIMSRLSKAIHNDTSFLEYLHMANEMASRSGDSARIANNLVNTGMGYLSIGKYARGLRFLLKGWEYDRKVFPYRDIYASRDISRAYLALDSLEKAEYFARRSLRLAKSIRACNWIGQSYVTMALYYERVGQFDSARYCMGQALKQEKFRGRNVPAPGLYRMMSDICIKMEDHESAAHYLDTSYQYFTMMGRMNNQDEMSRMRAEFDYDLQRAKIQELRIWNSLEKEKNRRYVIVVITILLVLVLTIGFLWGMRQQYSKLRVSYLSLVKKNLELDRLNARLRSVEKQGRRTASESIRDEDVIFEKLLLHLENDRIYRDPELTLGKLATVMGTNTTYLSAIINSHFATNFKSLVHKYRIDEARQLLVSGDFDYYSIDGIAREVGYRSRSVFYQAFKQVTGVTPSVYIENYRKALENNHDH